MKRPLAAVGLTYLATSDAAVCFLPQANFILCILAVISAIAACFIFRERTRDILLILCPLSIAFLVIGCCQLSANSLCDRLDGQTCEISGEICEIPHIQYGRWRYTIQTDKVDIPGAKQNIRILITTRKALDEAKEGDHVTCRVQFLKSDRETGYNSTTSLRADGIDAKAWRMPYDEYELIQESGGVRYLPMKIRRAVASAIRKALPDHASAMLCGMILGDKEYINSSTVDNFRSTGIAHLLAVSGLHITMLTFALQAVLRRMKLHKKYSSAATICFILAFMAVTGFPPSVVRAGVMHITAQLGTILMRDSDSLTSMSIAILIMCLTNPWAAADIGLQLSVCSTLGLLLAAGRINKSLLHSARQFLTRLNRMPRNKRIRRYGKTVIRSLSVSLAAGLAILPLTAVHFGSVPLISPVTNLLCVYIASVFLVIGIFASAVYCIPFVGWIISLPLRFVAAVLCAYLEAVTGALAKLPFSVLNTSFPYMPYLFLFITALAGAGFLSIRIIRNPDFSRRLRRFVLCGITVLMFVGMLTNEIFCKGPEIIIFDVSGGGVCVCAKNGTRAIFAEAGGNSYTLSAIKRTLRTKGVRKVDAIALSDDSDSRSGNLGRLTELYDPDYLITNEEFEVRGNSDIVPFENGIKSGNTEIRLETFIDGTGEKWQKLKCGNSTALICPENGDCSLLPENWRTVDAAIVGKRINGVPSLRVGVIITTATDKKAELLKMRMRSIGVRHVYSTYSVGNITLSVKDGTLRVSASE